MTQALQQPAALVPAKLALSSITSWLMWGVGRSHVELLGLRKANVLLVSHE